MGYNRKAQPKLLIFNFYDYRNNLNLWKTVGINQSLQSKHVTWYILICLYLRDKKWQAIKMVLINSATIFHCNGKVYHTKQFRSRSNFLSNCVLHLIEKRWKCFIGMSNLKKYKIGKQQTSGPNRNKHIKHNEQGRK